MDNFRIIVLLFINYNLILSDIYLITDTMIISNLHLTITLTFYAIRGIFHHYRHIKMKMLTKVKKIYFLNNIIRWIYQLYEFILGKIIIHSPLENYTNIIVRGKWNLQAIKRAGFTSKKLDDNMLSELSWSYNNYFNQNELIINAKVAFY